jgi:hypothetical protein
LLHKSAKLPLRQPRLPLLTLLPLPLDFELNTKRLCTNWASRRR